MRIGEFVEAVESYGARVPKAIRNGRTNQAYDELLGLAPVGHGNRRNYTPRQVRQMVAWQLIHETAGRAEGSPIQAKQHLRATRLMAAAPEGWIVMADGWASWSLVYPIGTLRNQCAVAIPVPAWRH